MTFKVNARYLECRWEGSVLIKSQVVSFLTILVVPSAVVAETAAESDDYDDYVESSDEEAVESELDSLTGLRSWHPSGAVEFKTSAVCPSPYYDEYVIFAVFTNSEGLDEINFAVVDGNSLSENYGEIIYSHKMLPTNTTQIDHIDCANGDAAVYAVFDRWNGDQRNVPLWFGVNPDPDSPEHTYLYSVPHCGMNPSPFNHPYGSSIAFNGNHIAVAAGNPEGTCGLCVSLFSTNGTLYAAYGDTGVEGGWVYATDIEWVDEDDDFVIAYFYLLDGGSIWTIDTTLMNDANPISLFSPCAGGLWCQVFSSGVHDPYEFDLELIYTPSDFNTTNRMLIQTVSNAIWIYSDGQEIVNANNPQGPFWFLDRNRASCEIWSEENPDQYHIAHTFSLNRATTVHRQWHRSPYPAQHVYNVRAYYAPESCASSDGYDDAEILLVSRSQMVGWEGVLYFNIEPQE